MNDKNGLDKKLTESRSNIGSMSFSEIKKFIGVDTNVDTMEDASGMPTNPEAGYSNTQSDQK